MTWPLFKSHSSAETQCLACRAPVPQIALLIIGWLEGNYRLPAMQSQFLFSEALWLYHYPQLGTWLLRTATICILLLLFKRHPPHWFDLTILGDSNPKKEGQGLGPSSLPNTASIQGDVHISSVNNPRRLPCSRAHKRWRRGCCWCCWHRHVPAHPVYVSFHRICTIKSVSLSDLS